MTSASLALDNWLGLFVIIWKELKMAIVSFRWALATLSRGCSCAVSVLLWLLKLPYDQRLRSPTDENLFLWTRKWP